MGKVLIKINKQWFEPLYYNFVACLIQPFYSMSGVEPLQFEPTYPPQI